MPAQTARQVLGFNKESSMDHASNIKPDPDSTERDVLSGGGNAAVPRVTSEHADQMSPKDGRKGGVDGTSSTDVAKHELDPVPADTRHDRYMGRGPGKKTIDAKIADRS